MLARSRTFFALPRKAKIDLIASRMLRKFFGLFSGFFLCDKGVLTYTPDSIAHAGAYPYVKNLYQSFRKLNKHNNGGDISRLISIVLNIEHVLGEMGVEGDLAEVGVWKGNTASVLAYYATKFRRKCYLFDTYEGFDKKDLVSSDAKFTEGHFSDTSIKVVKDVIGRELIDSCELIKGYFPDSIPTDLASKKFAVVSLDADLYQPTKSGLDWFFPRMHDGAILLLHDYSSQYWGGCKQAIDEFCKEKKQNVVLLPDKSGSAFIRVSH